MSQPFFSVVVPTYNRCELLRESLRSIQAQIWRDFEVIVVDSLSDDGTEAMIADQAGEIQYIRRKNGGPGPARNIGIEAARGRYIAFLDSDDLWFPWTLASYHRAIEAHPKASFLVGKPRVFKDLDEIITIEAEPPVYNVFPDYLASGDAWRWFGVSSFVISSEAVRAAGGFDHRGLNAEDADLALRLGTAPGFVEVTSPIQFAYRAHDANLTKNEAQNLAGLRAMLENEREGVYPGGMEREKERHRIITRHLRPVALACLRSKQIRDGWALYSKAFYPHLKLRNLRFICAYPFLTAAALARRKAR